MPLFFGHTLRSAWLVLLAYWLRPARSDKPSVQQESLTMRITAYWLPLFVAIMLLGPGDWFGPSLLRKQFVPHATWVYSIGLGLAISGVAWAIIACAMLGRNWIATVQLKQNHQLITRGPYRFARHPIYTGLLTLFLRNAFMVQNWRGLLAAFIVFVSFWRKLHPEEVWLGEHFEEVYRLY